MTRCWYVIDHIVNRTMWMNLRQMESSQSASWREIAAPKLERLLTWSQLHVPACHGIQRSHSGDVLDVLGKLPITTRQELVDDPDRFTSDTLHRSAHWKSTGGSSGVLLHVLQDSRYGAANSAGSYLFFRWVGWRPTDRIQKIWGSFTESMGNHPSVKRRFRNWLLGQPQLDGYAIREGDFDRYIDVIDRTKPEIILSYVDAAESLAEYMNLNGRRLGYAPRGIVTATGTLFPTWRKNIERAFGCRVYNRYASEEAGCIACTRGEDALYVNPSTHIVEVVDAAGNRIAEGTGRILLTVLNNLCMPLIRYDTGDYATIENPASLYPLDGWQRLESVDGREVTMLRGSDGSRFSPSLFTSPIDVFHNKGLVSQYQIIQRGFEKYTIRLKLWPGLNPGDQRVVAALDDLRHDLVRVFGATSIIEFAFVDQVEVLPSGKVPFCIVRFDDHMDNGNGPA